MSELRLLWLGPPTVELDDRPLQLEMRKTLALLAYLSLSPQPPTRETLATLFWSEFDQQSAFANLRRNLASLTKRLPPGIFEADRERIGLIKGVAVNVDVDRFRSRIEQVDNHHHPSGPPCPDCKSALEDAVHTYRGDFFQGFNLKDCPEFDDWQFFQREDLRTAYGTALEKLAGYCVELSEWEKAVRYAHSWLALDRLHEPAYRLLIRLYNLSGQKSAALRQYEECKQILEKELGQPPDAQTQELYAEIRASQPERRREPAAAIPKPARVESELPLVRTKLFLPKVPRTLVHRPRLIEQLNQSTQIPLTLISASAGFGKSTLLADWAEKVNLPVAWVSLDKGDNDPQRLMRYIVSSIRQALPVANIGSKSLDLLHTSEPPGLDVILSLLVNDLITADKDLVLILDDYHLIQNPPAHEVILFLLEHQPAPLHILLASRTDPPLPLARMRANCQIGEIRIEDLRFNREEAGVFLSRATGFDLSEQDLAYLDEKIEGWIAGIQMAAIAMQSKAQAPSLIEVQGFIQGFRGSHRYILDYLVEEVLNYQPVEIREFLFKTSILERMCGALCDRLQTDSSSAQTPGSNAELAIGHLTGQSILEQLERNNLFVIPLDDERKWYRYHHLFADLLHVRLEQQDPLRVAALHRLAAGWFYENSLASEAIRHALAAHDYAFAGDVVEKYALRMINRSEIVTLAEWIQALPQEMVRSRPRLVLYRAWIHSRMGQIEEIEQAVGVVAEHLDAGAQGSEEIKNLITMLRAYQANMLGDTEAAIHITLGETTIDTSRITPENYKAYFQLGYACYTRGDLDAAERIFSAVARAAEQAEDIYNATISQGELAGIQVVRGSLKGAEVIYYQILDQIRSSVPQTAILECIFNISLAGIEYEKNNLDAAEKLVDAGMEAARAGSRNNSIAFGLTTRAYICLAGAYRQPENLYKAHDAIEEAALYIQNHKLYPRSKSQVYTCQVAIWLAEGELLKAQTWMQEFLPAPEDPLPFYKELEHIAAAQVLLAWKRYDEASSLLERLSSEAEAGNRLGRRLKIEILRSLALDGLKRSKEALGVLKSCLEFARQEEYVRVFLDEGAPMLALIQRGLQRQIWPGPERAYAENLLGDF